jgi:hypothetical protein
MQHHQSVKKLYTDLSSFRPVKARYTDCNRVPWIPEPSTVNREFKIYDAAGSTTRSEFQLKNER